jgi:hypothetical protein
VCPGGKGKQKKKPKYMASVEAISSTDGRAHPWAGGVLFFGDFFDRNIIFLMRRSISGHYTI